jgi:2',3'-cyclic-nucleotide 2'-phosphodiesterase (5'-nucleotidase family)
MLFKILGQFICAGMFIITAVSCSQTGGQAGLQPGSRVKFPDSFASPPANFLNIIHINDVYDVRQSPRCLAKMDLYTNANTLKLFSGDIMGPSIISDIQHGDQMIKIMQAFKFDFSVIGNHEFDFTEEHFLEWNNKVNQGMGTHRHIWLASNIKHKSGQKKQAGNAEVYGTRTINGQKICAFGLVDTYWIEGSKIDPDEFDYEDFKLAARRISKSLRRDENCEFIFAITHMENKSDEELLTDAASDTNAEGNDVDFVFGGHDHIFYIKKIGERVLLKSGMDFEQFANIKMWWGDKLEKTAHPQNYHMNKFTFLLDEELNGDKKEFIFSLYRPNGVNQKKYLNILIQRVVTVRSDPKHTELANYIKTQIDPLIATNLKAAIHIQNKLDARERHMFAGESNIMNFFADVGRAYYGAEVSIVNIRMLKGEKVFHSDTYLRRLDFMRLFPYHEDRYVEIELTGQEILTLLTDAVPLIHKHNKRMIGVSGISFQYSQTSIGDDDHPVYDCKLLPASVKINGANLVLTQKYKTVVVSSLLKAKVGFPSTIDKTVLTEKSQQVEPMDVFDFLGGMMNAKPVDYANEFKFFKEGKCQGVGLEAFSRIQPSGNNLVDLFQQAKSANSCAELLAQANPATLRRVRFYSITDMLKTSVDRTILSFKTEVPPRMTVAKRLIL